jgi:hypothetical protein
MGMPDEWLIWKLTYTVQSSRHSSVWVLDHKPGAAYCDRRQSWFTARVDSQ